MQLFTNSFWKQLSSRPEDDVICHYKGKAFTVAYIKQKATVLAKNLRQESFKKGDKVVFALEPSVDFNIALYSCMLLGAQVAIIDPHMGRIHYQAMLKQFNPTWALVDSRLLLLQEHPILRYLYFKIKPNGIFLPRNKNIKNIACGKNLPIFNAKFHLRKLYEQNNSNVYWEEIDSDDPFLLVYTSGTTDIPKAVMHSYTNLYASLNAVQHILQLQPTNSIATHLPHFVLLAVQANMIAYIWNENWSPVRKLEYLQKHNIQSLFQPPSELIPMIEWSEKNGSKLPVSLKHIMLGSAPIYPSFLERIYPLGHNSLKITCIYGMTEHLIVSFIDGRDKLKEVPSQGDCVGYPLKNVQTKIDDSGNLIISSDQLFQKYYHEEKRSDWHNTGDIVNLVEGKIYLKGRNKNMIIRRNTNIYPELYEPTLASTPGVKDAVLFGKYMIDQEDETIFLLIEPMDEQYSEKEILKQVKRKINLIHRDAAPEKIIFGRIPRKGRQLKVDRAALQSMIP
jgi:acyl-CoA synthetase (AMP-forming)/AMP-acid ligase II